MADKAVDFATSDGVRLTGRLALAEGASRRAAVVLHPHTQMGGNMHSHVVMAGCDALRQLGISSLRFNFRGAGDSGGTFDDGGDEQLDLTAALDFLRQASGAEELSIIAYSFGTKVALPYVSAHPSEVAAVVAIAPYPLPLIPSIKRPLLILAAERDQFMPLAKLRELADASPPSTTLRVLAGEGHMFSGGGGALTRLVVKVIQSVLISFCVIEVVERTQT